MQQAKNKNEEQEEGEEEEVPFSTRLAGARFCLPVHCRPLCTPIMATASNWRSRHVGPSGEMMRCTGINAGTAAGCRCCRRSRRTRARPPQPASLLREPQRRRRRQIRDPLAFPAESVGKFCRLALAVLPHWLAPAPVWCLQHCHPSEGAAALAP